MFLRYDSIQQTPYRIGNRVILLGIVEAHRLIMRKTGAHTHTVVRTLGVFLCSLFYSQQLKMFGVGRLLS